ncbi:hypothetical protein H4R34_000335 [Dimargaris verticillata]|uniref:Uncharacterized protein n=1 Tax=Dimargaris verticillata TaxID=2761393 RepID=A0A9W8EG20_9FUNG|nr:hypothetical protein H4R34_000335 [Dimargaris verticillata]
MLPKQATAVALAIGVCALSCLGAVLAAPANRLEPNFVYTPGNSAADVQPQRSDPKSLSLVLESMTTKELEGMVYQLQAILASQRRQHGTSRGTIAGYNTDTLPAASNGANEYPLSSNYPEFDEFIDLGS